MPKKATERDQEFGMALRRIRKSTGHTQTSAGRAVHWSQAKIQKIESGQQRVTDDDLEALLAFYDASDEARQEIAELRALAAPGAPDGATPCSYFLTLQQLEKRSDCTEVLAFYREGLPVPLQCDQYRLRMYELAEDATPPLKILEERNSRRGVLSRKNPPRYQAILSESSLLRVPGGDKELRSEQALHLLALLAEFPNLSVRILSFDAKISHVDLDMTMLKFAPDGHGPVVYTPFGRHGKLFKDKQEVAEAEAYWKSLHVAALSDEASRKYLNDLAH